MAGYDDLIQEFTPQSASTCRVLVYGESGSGKTTLAATFPKPVFIDTDRGMRGLSGTDIKRIRLPKGLAFNTMMAILTDALLKKGAFAAGGKMADRQTIVIDGFSALADEYLMEEIMIAEKRDPLVEKPLRDDYGRLKTELIQIGNLIKDVSDSYNVVATALVDEEKDELTGALQGKPLMTGKYRDIIGAVFDEEYFLECSDVGGQPKYMMYASKYKWYEAKTRLLKVSKMESPTFAKLRAEYKIPIVNKA